MTLLEFFDPQKVEMFANALLCNGGNSKLPEVCEGPMVALAFFNGLITGYQCAGGSDIDVIKQRLQDCVNRLTSQLVIPTVKDIEILGRK